MNTTIESFCWSDIKSFTTQDSAGRIYPCEHTWADIYIRLGGYRSPSRSWPNSYARPLMTRKFAKWLGDKDAGAKPSKSEFKKMFISGDINSFESKRIYLRADRNMIYASNGSSIYVSIARKLYNHVYNDGKNETSYKVSSDSNSVTIGCTRALKSEIKKIEHVLKI